MKVISLLAQSGKVALRRSLAEAVVTVARRGRSPPSVKESFTVPKVGGSSYSLVYLGGGSSYIAAIESFISFFPKVKTMACTRLLWIQLLTALGAVLPSLCGSERFASLNPRRDETGSSPKFLHERSPRRLAQLLSEQATRPGERDLLKRAPALLMPLLLCSPLGEGGGGARLSEHLSLERDPSA
ncbi:hypothetical protein DEO72_LG7g1132 [Vigna unguiculata]|uniref:Uncharacterized protein n=1 Tax=Vigna unguiculata TaxID=3917 RepID=A0A4D6MIN3_VIGUN|nr:hypothetical protein DEO72_LG7g1132 [Vigna unguiculata]